MRLLCIVMTLALTSQFVSAAGKTPAFCGAEGFGAYTPILPTTTATRMTMAIPI